MSLRKNLDNLLIELNKGIENIETKAHLNLDSLMILFDIDVSNPDHQLLKKTQNEIDERDKRIRTEGDNVEQLIVRILSLQAPVGPDLRRVLSCFRLIYDLERISRDAKHVFDYFLLFLDDREISDKSSDYMAKIFTDLKGGVEAGQSLLKNFVKAFFSNKLSDEDRDTLIATSREFDETIDDLFDKKIEELDKKTDDMVIENQTANAALFGLRSLERLGDHACNLLERSIYIQTGMKYSIK